MPSESSNARASDEIRAARLAGVERWVAFGIIAIYLSVTLALAFTDSPQSDEAIYANPGYNLVHSGKMGTTLYELRGYLPLSLAQRTYIQPPLFFLVTAALFRTVGFGLAEVRSLSILFGLVCLFSWYVIVRSLTNLTLPALLVAGLISVDYFFLIGASHGRMDMMCVGLGSAGLAIYMNWRKTNLRSATFWGNTLAALAMLTHPVGIVWAAGVVLAMVVLDRRLLSFKLLLVGAVPYLLAGAFWGAYILQDVTAFREQMRGTLLVNENSFDYSHLAHSRILRYLEQELISRYAAPFGLLAGARAISRFKILVLGTYLSGVFGILLVRRLRQNPRLLWASLFCISGFFLLAEVSPSKFSYYLPHMTVIMAACAGMFLYAVTPSPKWRMILTVAATVAVVQLGGAALVIRRNEYQRTFLPVIEAIERNSAPNSVVMSDGELWFGLWRDHTVLVDPLLGFRSGIRPDVFVMNTFFRAQQEREQRADPAAIEYMQDVVDRSHVVYKDPYSEVYVTDRTDRARRR